MINSVKGHVAVSGRVPCQGRELERPRGPCAQSISPSVPYHHIYHQLRKNALASWFAVCFSLVRGIERDAPYHLGTACSPIVTLLVRASDQNITKSFFERGFYRPRKILSPIARNALTDVRVNVFLSSSAASRKVVKTTDENCL